MLKKATESVHFQVSEWKTYIFFLGWMPRSNCWLCGVCCPGVTVGCVVCVFSLRTATLEAEAGGFLSSRPACSTEWVPGQPGLHRETLSQKTKPKKKKKKELPPFASTAAPAQSWGPLPPEVHSQFLFHFPEGTSLLICLTSSLTMTLQVFCSLYN